VELAIAKRALERARGYDGASQGRRLAGWSSVDQIPGAQPTTLAILRQRARDLRRNNPYFARALAGIVGNTVSYGIKARVPDGARALWSAWAETTACDADGRQDFYGLQALALQCIVESGEVFIRRRYRAPSEGLPAAVQIQVLEPDFLDVAKTATLENGNRIVFGIEYNRRSQPEAYWFLPEHPASGIVSVQRRSFRVPALDVAHVFRLDRPGQTRGVPWVAPVLTRLRQLDDYEDATLEKARIAACFAAFVYVPGEQDIPKLADPAAGDEADRSTMIEPGAVQYLPPGKDVKFAAPPSDSNHQSFTQTHLRAIASGLGVPYELLTGDLGQTSFSSARIGWLEFDRQIEAWRWTMLIPQLCARVHGWWADAVELGTGIRPGPATWSPPHRDMISPVEEVAGMQARIRAGLAPWSEVVREYGYDPDETLAEIAKYNREFDRHGIVLDTDPRKVNVGGQVQATAPAGGSHGRASG
jgi:lambda family phage portal protein